MLPLYPRPLGPASLKSLTLRGNREQTQDSRFHRRNLSGTSQARLPPGERALDRPRRPQSSRATFHPILVRHGRHHRPQGPSETRGNPWAFGPCAWERALAASFSVCGRRSPPSGRTGTLQEALRGRPALGVLWYRACAPSVEDQEQVTKQREVPDRSTGLRPVCGNTRGFLSRRDHLFPSPGRGKAAGPANANACRPHGAERAPRQSPGSSVPGLHPARRHLGSKTEGRGLHSGRTQDADDPGPLSASSSATRGP